MAEKNPLDILIDEAKREILKRKEPTEKFIEDRKEEMEAGKWLKKAKAMEKKKRFKEALNAYLKFMEIRLKIIESRPGFTLKSYFNLVTYYLKIANCYENVMHLRRGERTRDLRCAAENYIKAARIYRDVEKYDNAHKYYEIAAKRYREANEEKNAAEVYIEIGGMYKQLKDYLLTTSMYDRGAELYWTVGEYGHALDVHIKSAELNKEINNLAGASFNYGKVADCYRRLGDHKEAVRYYILSANLSSELDRISRMIQTYQSIARDYEDTKDYETAIYYYVTSAELAKDGDELIAGSGYESAARCYSRINDCKDAIPYYDKAAGIRIKLKRYLDAASCYNYIGECREEMGELENAGDSYFNYAELGLKDKNGSGAVVGYKKAAEVYMKAADIRLKEGKNEEGVGIYKKAASGYAGLTDYVSAGDIYYKAAEIESMIDYGESVSIYKEAAKFYEKGSDMGNAAKSYWKCKDYASALTFYLRYAGNQEGQENFFYAGEGYIKAAECNIKLKKKADTGKVYRKAIKQYLIYIDNMKKLELKGDENANPGRAYHGIGESYRALGELQNSEKYLERAVAYFQENNKSMDEIHSDAFLSLIKAKAAIQQGDYPVASDFLSRSIEHINESIEKGKWDKDYVRFLEDTKEESKKMLSEISKKPEVTLLIDRHSYTFVNDAVIINIIVTNHGKSPINKVTFLSHLPEDLRVVMPPTDIGEIKPDEACKNSIEIISDKANEYHIKPLEVLYNDESGNKYVKSSNPITIKVVERPGIDYKDYGIAINSYLQYAEMQLQNKNYFHAGEGYRGIAEVYGRFGEDIKMEEFYHKSIDNYLEYVEGMAGEGKMDVIHLSRMNESCKNVGEIYERINNLPEAEKYFKMALDSYNKTKIKTTKHSEKLLIESQIIVVDAFISKVKAKAFIKHGNYPEAKKYLEKSTKRFDDAIKKGGWGREYENFLDKNQEEIKVLLDEIGRKPAVSLSISYAQQKAKAKVKKDKPVEIKLSITNKWEGDIHNIKFLTRLPEEFELKTLPGKIPVLKPGETREIPIELLPRNSGRFRFKLLDMVYQDKDGDNYMMSSDVVSLEVE